jgi:hypothetical protein
MATPTRTDKVMTRSETAKIDKYYSDFVSITESHRRDGCTKDGWNTLFHNGKCQDDDDEYYEPCRCCIAQLFRKEGHDNPCNVACRVCFNWKGDLPGTKSFYKE